MSDAILNSAKKRMGRPKVDSEAVNIRIQRPLLSALDAFISEQQPFHQKKLTRPEAVRMLMQEALAKNGLTTPDKD